MKWVRATAASVGGCAGIGGCGLGSLASCRRHVRASANGPATALTCRPYVISSTPVSITCGERTGSLDKSAPIARPHRTGTVLPAIQTDSRP